MIKNNKKVFIITFVFIVLLVVVISNKIGNRYEDLNGTDRAIINELDEYFKFNSKNPIWPDFQLENKTILAVNGRLGGAYLINPTKEISSLFAQEIKMPSSVSTKVYRISAFAPQLLRYKITPGNFNTHNKIYSIFGNEVYYIRYMKKSVSKDVCNSMHYLTFLSHESFHYYMQSNWRNSGRFDTEDLKREDIDLLEEQYKVLAEIQKEINSDNLSRDSLLKLSKEYVNIIERRIALNPKYMEDELMAETEEGTATYIGIKASKSINYDFDVMKFSEDGINSQEVSFDKVIPSIKNGDISISTLSSDWVYQTGAELCMLLDELEVPDWKEKLNSQTEEKPITLYDLLKIYIDGNL